MFHKKTKPWPEPELEPEPPPSAPAPAVSPDAERADRLQALVERLQGGMPSPDSVARVIAGLQNEIRLLRGK